MTWKERVNSALVRATGYRVVKASTPVGRAAAPRPRPKPAPAPKPKPAAAAPKPAAAKKPPAIPPHYDEDARRIIAAVRPWTMTANEKLFGLIVATRYVLDHRIEGDFVECGVWRGGSMQAIAHTLLSRGVRDRDLHLFDTFEGMPEPTERDRTNTGELASAVLARRPKTANVWAIASLEDVQDGMAKTGYPDERIHFHPGRVEETIPEAAPERIAILRLDTDWYESTRHELEHLYDRVPSGGVVIFDDYGTWQGAREAVDEFLERTGERLLLAPISQGRIAVKP